jgi:hypothetical protein
MVGNEGDQPDEVRERIIAHYANYLEIGHNEYEFLFDFGELYQQDEPWRLHTRIVTGPVYAKAFLKVLKDAVARYEQNFGLIEDD